MGGTYSTNGGDEKCFRFSRRIKERAHIRRQSCRCKDSLILKTKTQNSFGTSSDTASHPRNLNLQQNRWPNLISPRIILNYILQKHGVNCVERARNNCQRWAAVTTHMSRVCPVPVPQDNLFACHFVQISATLVTHLTAKSQLTYSTNKTGSFKLPVPKCRQTQQMNGLCV